MSAPTIPSGSWLNDEQYAEFREAYEYARNRPQASGALSKLTPQEAYYVWQYLQRGYVRQDAEAAETRGRRLFNTLAEDLWAMPSMSGVGWRELPAEDRTLWMMAADAAAG